MITEYSQKLKESMLQKIFFNPDQSVVSFARKANIPSSTVATWVRNYKKKNGKIMGQEKGGLNNERKKLVVAFSGRVWSLACRVGRSLETYERI